MTEYLCGSCVVYQTYSPLSVEHLLRYLDFSREKKLSAL